MAVCDAYVFLGFLTPVLTQLFFPKPPTTFLTCFCRGERRKYTGKKSRLNRGSNSQLPGHESDTFTTEPPGRGPHVSTDIRLRSPHVSTGIRLSSPHVSTDIRLCSPHVWTDIRLCCPDVSTDIRLSSPHPLFVSVYSINIFIIFFDQTAIFWTDLY